RLLQMPRTLSDLARVLDDLQAKHRALAHSLRGSYRRDAEDAVIAELEDRARSLHALLRENAEFHWVLLAEELSLSEARDGIAALRAAGLRAVRAIANRLTPAPDGKCALCQARRGAESAVLRKARSLGLPLAGIPVQDREPRGLPALARVAAQLDRKFLGHLTKSFKSLTLSKGRIPLDILAPAGTRLVFFGGKGGVGK